MKIVIVLIILLFIGGLSAVGQFIEILYSITKMGVLTFFLFMDFLPTSIFDILEKAISDQWTLTGIVWIDVTLLNVASFIPSGFSFLITSLGLKLDWLISGVISLLIFIGVLTLFSSPIFWICILLLMICLIVLLVLKNKDKKEVSTGAENIESNSHIIKDEQAIVVSKPTININKCPWCNSYLVKRKGPYGYFKGCKSYPSCKYTEKI